MFARRIRFKYFVCKLRKRERDFLLRWLQRRQKKQKDQARTTGADNATGAQCRGRCGVCDSRRKKIGVIYPRTRCLSGNIFLCARLSLANTHPSSTMLDSRLLRQFMTNRKLTPVARSIVCIHNMGHIALPPAGMRQASGACCVTPAYNWWEDITRTIRPAIGAIIGWIQLGFVQCDAHDVANKEVDQHHFVYSYVIGKCKICATKGVEWELKLFFFI